MIFTTHFLKSDVNYVSPQGHQRLCPPNEKFWVHISNLATSFVILSCAFVKLQRSVTT